MFNIRLMGESAVCYKYTSQCDFIFSSSTAAICEMVFSISGVSDLPKNGRRATAGTFLVYNRCVDAISAWARRSAYVTKPEGGGIFER